jgi:hypothetical protein
VTATGARKRKREERGGRGRRVRALPGSDATLV